MTSLVIAEHDNAFIKPATLNTITAALQCGGDAITGQVVTRTRLHQFGRLLRGIRQVGDRAECVFTIITRAGVQQHVTA